MDYPQFVTLHESQLKKAGIGTELWPSLYAKLVGEVYDAGNYVGLFRVEDEEDEEEEDEKEEEEEDEKEVKDDKVVSFNRCAI